jgi:hypothetical protein
MYAMRRHYQTLREARHMPKQVHAHAEQGASLAGAPRNQGGRAAMQMHQHASLAVLLLVLAAMVSSTGAAPVSLVVTNDQGAATHGWMGLLYL